jgi:hypothetical protein
MFQALQKLSVNSGLMCRFGVEDVGFKVWSVRRKGFMV